MSQKSFSGNKTDEFPYVGFGVSPGPRSHRTPGIICTSIIYPFIIDIYRSTNVVNKLIITKTFTFSDKNFEKNDGERQIEFSVFQD